MFECWLTLPGDKETSGQEIRGDWRSIGNDKPPWNIGPESSISFGLACFFDVPLDFDIPDTFQIGIDFITANGKSFHHTFLPSMPASSNQT